MGALFDGERLLALARRAHETDGLLAREAPLKQEPWIRNTHVGQLHGEQRLAGAVVVGVPGVDRGGTGGVLRSPAAGPRDPPWWLAR
jgi:hypothetical protein